MISEILWRGYKSEVIIVCVTILLFSLHKIRVSSFQICFVEDIPFFVVVVIKKGGEG